MAKSGVKFSYEISPELLRRHLQDCRLLSGKKIYGMGHEIAVNFHRWFFERFILNKEHRIVVVSDGERVLGLAMVRHKKNESGILKTKIASIEWLSVVNDLPQNVRMNVSLILVEETSNVLARNKFDLVTLLVDVDDTELLLALQQSGYQIYATNTTYTLNLRKVLEFQMPDTLLLRLMQPSEVLAVMNSASIAFSDYRSHYHFDPKLLSKLCTETYIKCIQHSIEAGDPVVIAVLKDSPNTIYGFLTFNWHSEVNEFFKDRKVGEIEIGGVVPEGRGRGVYDAMMRFGADWYSDNGARILVVNANIGNIAVQRCWQKMGFSLRRYQHRFHKWLS